ncbi:endonuclease [Leptotrichia sp. OH3620_COT-345]|nr:endonuclease [Leptotrichia sp. OH3620_COT-345]
MRKSLKRILLFIVITLTISAKEFRIMTYNIYGGRLANGTKIGQSIKRYKPDFIALQEVDKFTKRSNIKDITKDIADELGYNYYYFQKSRDFDSGEFGISFVSKYPIETIQTYELPSIGIEKRQVIAAKIEKTVFGKSVLIINTHLDYKQEAKNEELNSLLIMSEIVEGDIKFLSGDLNILPTTEYYKQITQNWKDMYLDGDKAGIRNNDDPRIDYILGDLSGNWKIKESFFINDDTQEWTKLSDHLPYMSIVDIK